MRMLTTTQQQQQNMLLEQTHDNVPIALMQKRLIRLCKDEKNKF